MRSLQALRTAAGWTIQVQAERLGINIETLRGVLFHKNHPGSLVLEKVAAFADRANPRRVGTQVFLEAQRLGTLAWELLGPPSLKEVLDALYRRMVNDFGDLRKLLKFTRVDSGEWQRFANGATPSANFLEAVATAYSEEAARVTAKDGADAEWCRQIAALATKAMNRVLT